MTQDTSVTPLSQGEGTEPWILKIYTDLRVLL
ncbi:hypothetical protein PS947_05474 [Pseudomonas fluorescens]|nr:hypothetical protein PS947_05474 [Pseudomonas fluorescens]